eukprot:12709650-Ditylum_brightwellii.AAC.1
MGLEKQGKEIVTSTKGTPHHTWEGYICRSHHLTSTGSYPTGHWDPDTSEVLGSCHHGGPCLKL